MYSVQSHFYDESALCDDIEHVLFRIMSLFYRDDCPFVTKYVRTISKYENRKNTHKLCKENEKNERAEVSANSFVLAETPKECSANTKHTTAIEIHCRANKCHATLLKV